MQYKRILTIQDISCVGQCSLTVALPVLSACGLETAILPSAVLSTHTGGFQGYTFRDLTEDIPQIAAHWETEKIGFSAVYTGYLGSVRQIGMVKEICEKAASRGGTILVDPAMADNGKLYYGFDDAYVQAMKTLCACADVVLPNITEAAFLTGTPYTEHADRTYVAELVEKLHALGAKSVVLTGVGYSPEKTGVLVSSNGKTQYYCHRKIPKSYHGTGDLYASALTGAYLQGISLYDSAVLAADFIVRCIEATILDENHWYGVKFEPELASLITEIRSRLSDGE